MKTVVSSRSKEVVIGDGRPTVVIGEVSDDGNRQTLEKMLHSKDFSLIQREALMQVQAGAEVIDIMLNLPRNDEVSLLAASVQALMEAVDVPLSFHSFNLTALEAALAVYQGKPLINGLSAKPESLAAILPLARKYGAAVIVQAHDSERFPGTPERRVALAKDIIDRAKDFDIRSEDVIIDCLTFSSVEQKAGRTSIETIRRVNLELGVNTLIGDKHISFGLPEPGLLDQTFAAVAIGAGVTCLMADAIRIGAAVLAADLMVGRDRYARRYIGAYRQRR